MAADGVVGSRQLINLLIRGNGSVTGLQDRLDALFTGNARPRVKSRYSYDAGEQGMEVISVPLPRPLVTISTLVRTSIDFYKNGRLPGSSDTLAWANKHHVQIDIWARTPVEKDAISDAVETELKRMHAEFWQASRIAVKIESFEDVAFEADQGVYRSMGRGYVQLSATSAA